MFESSLMGRSVTVTLPDAPNGYDRVDGSIVAVVQPHDRAALWVYVEPYHTGEDVLHAKLESCTLRTGRRPLRGWED